MRLRRVIDAWQERQVSTISGAPSQELGLLRASRSDGSVKRAATPMIVVAVLALTGGPALAVTKRCPSGKT